MKKNLFGLIFVIAGALMWGVLSQSARWSLKKWDAKFDTVMRLTLSDLGVGNEDVLSSVNEIQIDDAGEYVIRRIKLKKISKDKRSKLAKELENSGAKVKLKNVSGGKELTVFRGERIYQKIEFVDPA